ncbi:hypothetical protein EAI89_10275 [Eubacterium sp. am_0171]|nr:hypothetical protein EAI89_10275 [Eubacterium sp. am_0171]
MTCIFPYFHISKSNIPIYARGKHTIPYSRGWAFQGGTFCTRKAFGAGEADWGGCVWTELGLDFFAGVWDCFLEALERI